MARMIRVECLRLIYIMCRFAGIPPSPSLFHAFAAARLDACACGAPPLFRRLRLVVGRGVVRPDIVAISMAEPSPPAMTFASLQSPCRNPPPC